MKKFIALTLALTMAMAFAGCASKAPADDTTAGTTEAVDTSAPETTGASESTDGVKVMSHEEFVAAPVDSEVTVETYVQAKQGWWEDKATFYTQAEDGAYFVYEMPCSEEDYEKLTQGTKIRVTGTKAEWSGEVEIVDATFEILEGNFVAEALDVTEMLANEEELLKHQNELVAANGLTVKKVAYKNEEPGDDIYLTLALGDAEYTFCVEVYLTGTDSEVYKTVGELKEGDVVDVEGFLYWYEGANPHITAITVK